MTSLQQSQLAEHIDAALASLAPATAARLAHPDKAQRQSAIAIMAQTLAARLDSDVHSQTESDASYLPGLPVDLH